MFQIIQIQTTSKCSGNCLICPYSTSWHKNNSGYMSDEDFEHVLLEIQKFNPNFNEHFSPYLMQDPLSDSKIVERIEKIFQVFPKCYIELSTNAMLLTPKLSEQIVETITKYDKTHRSQIWISHHAINKKTYEAMMRRKNYNKTLNNILEYLMINEGRLQTRIRGAGQSIDNTMFAFSQSDYNDFWTRIITENRIKPLNTAIEYFPFHNRAGNVHFGKWDGNEFERTIDLYHPFTCNRYINGLHILYNSDVVCCCMDYFHKNVWGNLKIQSLKRIWKGKKRQNFVDKAIGLKKSNKNFICKKCFNPGG